jgi:hypothetical protein
MPLRVIGISGGRVWMTTRRSESLGWTPWTDLTTVVGPIAAPHAVACAIVNGQLQICVLEQNALWHTLELGPNSFTGWGPAHVVAFPRVSLGLRVACAPFDAQLHVCVDGNRTTVTSTAEPAIWRSIRNSNGAFSPPREVTGRAPAIVDVACASVKLPGQTRPQLEVLTRSQTAGALHPLLRTTLLPTGASSGDVTVAATVPPAAAKSDLPAIRTVAAAGIGAELHVLLAQDPSSGRPAELFHAILTGAGIELFGNVRALVGDAAFGSNPLTTPACANVGGNLHVCAISNGQIMHTIRLSSGAWLNPESNTVGIFGNVTAVVSGGPSTPFVSIACAGDPF